MARRGPDSAQLRLRAATGTASTMAHPYPQPGTPGASRNGTPKPRLQTSHLAAPDPSASVQRFSFTPEPGAIAQRVSELHPPPASPTDSDIDESPTSPEVRRRRSQAPAPLQPVQVAHVPMALDTGSLAPASPWPRDAKPPLASPRSPPPPRPEGPPQHAAQGRAAAPAHVTYPRPMTVVAPRAQHHAHSPAAAQPPSYAAQPPATPRKPSAASQPPPAAAAPIEPDHKPTFTSPTTPRQNHHAFPSPQNHHAFPPPPSTTTTSATTAYAPPAPTTPSWSSGLCTPDATCLLAYTCPCVLYGRTAHRLRQRAAHRPATDLNGLGGCNARCVAFGALACFAGPLAAALRGKVRRMYGIEGGTREDCGVGCCCCCGVLGQVEREVVRREEGRGEAKGYGRSEGMVYEVPPR